MTWHIFLYRYLCLYFFCFAQVPLPEGTLVCMDAQFLKGSHASLLSEGRSLRRNVRMIVLTSSIFSIFLFIITSFSSPCPLR